MPITPSKALMSQVQAMGIDVRQSSLNNRTVSGKAPEAADSGPSRAADRAGGSEAAFRDGDRVDLSSTSRTLKALAESARQGPEIDAARVERIRAEIAEGKYHVDSSRLAERIADLEAELQGS